MTDFTPIMLSALFGLVSVELFGGAWLAGLGVIAAVVLLLMKRITPRQCLRRAHAHGAWGLFRIALLILSFTVYLRMGMGFEPLQMMGYFIGAVLGLLFFFSGVSSRIDEMFASRKNK